MLGGFTAGTRAKTDLRPPEAESIMSVVAFLTAETVSAAGFVGGRDARWNGRTFDLVAGIGIGAYADCEDRDGGAEGAEAPATKLGMEE